MNVKISMIRQIVHPFVIWMRPRFTRILLIVTRLLKLVKKKVNSFTTGYERTRISVEFTATSSGYKIKAIFVNSEKKTIKRLYTS